MSENQQPKKVNLADAMKEMLAKKKQQQAEHKGNFHSNSTKTMKSQNTKKPNNQRRRTGGS